VKPEIVNGDCMLVFELIRPFAAVLVLLVLPLWPDALLEQMVVGLEGEFGRLGDVVLDV